MKSMSVREYVNSHPIGGTGSVKMPMSDKFRQVMSEFKDGSLHSGSGEVVTKRKQAQAIAASVSKISKKKRKK